MATKGSEILGLDPLYVANEGRFVGFLPASEVQKALSILHSHEISRKAAEIGEVGSVLEFEGGLVTLKTVVGTSRILDLLSGEQLPRIC